MTFIGAGTLINVVAIVLGSLLGLIASQRLSDSTRTLVTDVLGVITLLGAASALIPLWSHEYISAFPSGWSLLLILAALLIGGVLGSLLKLEKRLDGLGENLRIKFGAETEGGFVEGFVSASLLFVIGPLAILGSISDGLQQGIDQLLLKSSLDFFAAMAFASSFGWAVSLSALPVAVYQGLWTAIGWLLGNVMQGYQIAAMTIVGGCLLMGIGLRLLKIKSIAVGNLLPALFLAPVLALLIHQFV